MDQNNNQNVGCGCGPIMGIVALVVVALVIVVAIVGPPKVDVNISNGVANCKHKIPTRWGLDLAGSNTADDVYRVATQHPEIRKIVVSFYFVPINMDDKYGHEAHGDRFMGTIEIDDLEEVRRYASSGAYANSRGDIFAAQIGSMEYAEYIRR
jgi:hypothetical protein